MKRAFQALVVTVFAAEVLVVGQGGEVAKVLADLRAALGGDKVAAVTTLAIEGRSTRSMNDNSLTSDFELAFELPDKFMKKDVVGNFNGMSMSRRSGFNGPGVIDETDAPPPSSMMGGGGGMRIMAMGPGAMGPGGKVSPEQLEAQRKVSLAASRREFARLALGLLGGTSQAFPLEFKYAGQAEAPDGKADVLEVTGPDGFVGRFFVDSKTHLPLMFSWMDKEPLRLSIGGGPAPAGAPGAHVQTFTRGTATSPQDAEKMQQELTARMQEAEANRRTVEFRVFYADYKTVDGVHLPTRIQRMVDGFATEELSLEKIRINQKIDQKKFETVK